MKNIKVPNPCSENWESMSPQEQGRFCMACSKCVIDFTQKQPEEIQYILAEKKSKHICGRFYSHQLNKADRPEDLKAYLLNRIPSYFQSNRILLSLFSFIVFLAGCSKQKEACTTTTGALVSDAETDTLENNNFVMGEPLAIENDSVAKIYKKDSSIVKGKNSTK